MRNMNPMSGNCPSRCGTYSNYMQTQIPNCQCSCQCEDDSTSCGDPLRGMPLGIGYVPWQSWGCTYNYDEALCKGTIFTQLDLPFYGCIPRGYQTNKGGNA